MKDYILNGNLKLSQFEIGMFEKILFITVSTSKLWNSSEFPLAGS